MEDLSSKLKSSLERTDPHSDSLGLQDALDRGRRARRKRALAAATTSFLVAGVGLAGVFGVFGATEQNRTDRFAPATQDSGTVAEDGDIAGFAVRAAAEAGLIDDTDNFYDYERTVETQDGWQVFFTAFQCQRTTEETTCSKADATAVLHVVQEGDRYVISDSSGPMSSGSKQQLNGYSESTGEGEAGLDLVALQVLPPLGGNKGVAEVHGTILWTGPLPPESASATCTVEVLDSNGQVVYTHSVVGISITGGEAGRSGEQFGIGVPSEGNPVSARASC